MNEELSLGKLIKEHRRVLDLTQAELARRVGCATITLRKIEAETLRPSVQIAERLAMALKIPLEERADFVRLARMASLVTPSPPPLPTPPPLPEEIGEEDLSGRAIRGYQLGERVGEGGFGVVYRATQPLLEREVAVKIILPQYANHPDFIRRFETEAQLVARLEHPYIVPLYDFWREPNVAYLVMRLLRGGSLHARLKEGALSLAFTLRVLAQVCSALHAAHRMGVIHRDLKPANILLDEDENAYLVDFGIAKNLTNPDLEDQTQAETILGSPAYLSPEQIRSEMVRPQADIYSLGLLVYEMLTGVQPFQGPTPIEYMMQHLNEPIPRLSDRNPGLPSSLEAVIQRATAKDPTERYPDVPAMLAEVHTALGGVVFDEIPGLDLAELIVIDESEIENPYKGLRAFAEADADDFFGRETLIQELLGLLGQEGDLTRFLAVVGPSGSGKSSVVKAGLIPALRRGGLPGSDKWFIVEFTPGAHPLEELEIGLTRIATHPDLNLAEQLRRDARGLLRAARMVLPEDNSELLLVIDQFEELFTLLEDEAVRAHFLESLVTATLDPRSRVRVVITLRADFTDRPLSYVDFGELICERTAYVLPLTPDELEQAISAPARRVGMLMEAGLVNHILRDVGDQPGTLPLLQYALTELFERREGRRLTLAAYAESGGVLGALGRRAEEIYNGLDESGQEATRQLFLRLVTLGEGVEDTRRRVLRGELEALSASSEQRRTAIDQVIDTFGRYRLLTFDHDPVTRGPTVEVAHEALLREWARLRGWLDNSRADVRMQRLLGAAAESWRAAEHDPSYLLRGARLGQFEAWAAETDLAMTDAERDFLEASLAEREREAAEEAARQARELALEQRSRNFLRALAWVLAVAAVIAILLSIFAFQQRQTAQTQAGILLASQAESELEDGFSDRAILLALEALENYPYTAQAEHALGQAVTNNRALELYEGHASAVTGAAWSSDGARIATSSDDNSVHIWDPASGKNLTVIDLPKGITGNIYDWALTVKWSPDDRYLLTISGDRFLLGSQDYDLILWDAETGDQVAAHEVQNAVTPDAGDTGMGLGYHYTTGAGAAFAPDGRLASVGGDNSALVLAPMLADEQLVLRGHAAAVNGVDWSPDFTLLATASEDGSARIWDADSGEELMQLTGHEGAVNQVAWSPEGDLLATAGDDGSVLFWDAATGESLTAMMIIPAAGSGEADKRIVYSLAWSPDGDYLATGSGDGFIRIWDASNSEMIAEMKGHESFVTYLAWSPLDERLVSAGDDGRARLWNTTPDNRVLSLPYEYIPIGGWSPDGAYIIVGTNAGPDRAYKGMVAVWDFKAGEPLFETFVDKDEDWALEWLAIYSPDGQYILARTLHAWPDTTDTNKYYVLDSHSGEVVRMLETGVDTLLAIPGWSPDGRLAGGGDWEGTIYFWEVSSGELVRTLDCVGFASSVLWSPDGDKIAASCIDLTSHTTQFPVLDAHTYETLHTIEPGGFYQFFDWSPDSTLLAVAGGTVSIFDANSGEELREIVRHTGFVNGVVWSPDGNRIASASQDNTTRIWDAGTGAELLTLSTPNDQINYPAWSPDGQYLLVTISNATSGPGRSGVWRVWQTTQELIEYAKECCIFRELTTAERERFGLPAAP